MYTQLYFDYNATTPCDERVVEAMLPFFYSNFGNASSSHHPYGWLANDAIGEATDKIATALKISKSDIVFTSGATESINMILKGICKKMQKKGNHIITSKAEHKAVLDTCKFLESEGFNITYLDVDTNGLVILDQLKEAISSKTILVSLMYANNETGIIQPLEEISKLVKANNSLLFSDATQALGKIHLNTFFNHVDFACFSGHKLYGPKGVGLVYAKNNKETSLLPSFIQGGGQQRDLRGGTLNTPAIIGFAKAIDIAYKTLDDEIERLSLLKTKLEKGLLFIECSFLNSKTRQSLPNTVNISFQYVDGASLLRSLSKYIAVSNGSACNSASVEPSHVLIAMGIKPDIAYASLRLSIGRYTTEEEIKKAIAIIKKEIALQRDSNILWERR